MRDLFRRSRRCLVLAVAALCAALLCPAAWAEAGPLEPEDGGLLDLPMYRDPALRTPAVVQTFHPRLGELWLMGLDRPEVEERRRAAEAIGKAHTMGMTGHDDLLDRLIALAGDDPDALVRTTCIAALARIDDARAARAMLAALDAADPDRVRIADAALSRWLGRPEVAAAVRGPAVDAWVARAADAEAGVALRVSAVTALGAIKAGAAVDTLLAIVNDAALPQSLRLAAATAAARCAADPQRLAGRGDSAADVLRVAAVVFADSADPDAALLAVRLIARDDSAEAAALAQKLALSGDAVVAGEALDRLVQTDPGRVIALRERLVTEGRPNSRLRIARAFARTRSPEAPAALCDLLDDTSLDVRTFARDTLAAFAAEADRVDATREAVLAALREPAGWRQAEQAALVAGQIDLEPAADALLALLSHDRAEVRLASADALRRIAVPDALPGMLARAQAIAAAWPGAVGAEAPDAVLLRGYDAELTQLHQAFGAMRYAEAEAHLGRFVGKSQVFGSASRASAIYALGLLHGQAEDGGLAGKLAGRIKDIAGMEPESDEVRVFSAVALGHMKSQKQLAVLEQFATDEPGSLVGAACRWSRMPRIPWARCGKAARSAPSGVWAVSRSSPTSW